eukprot:jgi/Mesvir1/28902/Mv17990-RA.1
MSNGSTQFLDGQSFPGQQSGPASSTVLDGDNAPSAEGKLTVERLAQAMQEAEDKLDAAFASSEMLNRSLAEKRRTRTFKLRDMLDARERENEALRATLLATRRTLDARIEHAFAALAERENQLMQARDTIIAEQEDKAALISQQAELEAHLQAEVEENTRLANENGRLSAELQQLREELQQRLEGPCVQCYARRSMEHYGTVQAYVEQLRKRIMEERNGRKAVEAALKAQRAQERETHTLFMSLRDLILSGMASEGTNWARPRVHSDWDKHRGGSRDLDPGAAEPDADLARELGEVKRRQRETREVLRKLLARTDQPEGGPARADECGRFCHCTTKRGSPCHWCKGTCTICQGESSGYHPGRLSKRGFFTCCGAKPRVGVNHYCHWNHASCDGGNRST